MRWLARRDRWGLAVVLLWLVTLLTYRANFVEPRAWATACALAVVPFACVPRMALLWGQHWGLWGLSSLGLGISALIGAPFAISVAAVVAGIGGVVNYNATWGMLGLCLGAWAWIRSARSAVPG